MSPVENTALFVVPLSGPEKVLVELVLAFWKPSTTTPVEAALKPARSE